MVSRHRQIIKQLCGSQPEKRKLCQLLLNGLYRCVLSGNNDKAGILAKAITIIFSDKEAVMIANTRFKALWRLKRYDQAIRVYIQAGRMFWHAEEIGRYYERRGQIKKAMIEYEFLMETYMKMGRDFLPLPQGPKELFKLGRWYYERNDMAKAGRYLEMYMSAEQKCGTDPAHYLRHKVTAKKILNRLEATQEVGND